MWLWRSSVACCRYALAALAAACVLATPLARADSPEELARLREEAVQIRQSLERLEARIRALEGQTTPVAPLPKSDAATSGEAPDNIVSLVRLKQNWSQIERGMPQDQVKRLLGTPARELHIDGSLAWYYVYPGIGRGSVFFDGSGKATAVQAP